MRTALDQFRIDGVTTNRLALAALFEHERFLTGSLSTGFIDENFPNGFGELMPSNEVRRRMVALGAVLHHRLETRAGINDIVPPERREYSVRLGDSRDQVGVLETRQGYEVLLGDELMTLRTEWWPPQPVVAFEIDGADFFAQFDRHEMGYRMQHGSISLWIRVLPIHVDALFDKMPIKISSQLTNYLRSPMPGLLVSIAVEVGDSVNAGDEVAIVEAMKMENSLRVERDAVVAAVHASPGETLDVDQPIIEFEPDGA
jgi:propionyl-CoA carboxylase alpha chain